MTSGVLKSHNTEEVKTNRISKRGPPQPTAVGVSTGICIVRSTIPHLKNIKFVMNAHSSNIIHNKLHSVCDLPWINFQYYSRLEQSHI